MKENVKQIRYLKKEIEMLQRQIDDTELRTVSDIVKGSSTHFPYIERTIKITGLDHEGYERKVRRLKRQRQRRLDELVDVVEETDAYIANIEDSLTRQVLCLRYINGLPWEQVAASIGGGNTADSVRKVAERFLK